jgi:hypothetical protein
MSDRESLMPENSGSDQTGKTPDIMSTPSQSPIGAALDPTLQAHIGRQLRALYDEIVQQPIPDRFIQLLEELERKKAGSS